MNTNVLANETKKVTTKKQVTAKKETAKAEADKATQKAKAEADKKAINEKIELAIESEAKAAVMFNKTAEDITLKFMQVIDTKEAVNLQPNFAYITYVQGQKIKGLAVQLKGNVTSYSVVKSVISSLFVVLKKMYADGTNEIDNGRKYFNRLQSALRKTNTITYTNDKGEVEGAIKFESDLSMLAVKNDSEKMAELSALNHQAIRTYLHNETIKAIKLGTLLRRSQESYYKVMNFENK